MPVVIPSGFCQATVNFGGNGLAFPGAVVLGFDQGGGADPDDVAETIYDTWASTILTLQTSAITLESVLVKFGPNTTGPSGEHTGAEVGGLSGQGSPSNCAYLVRKNTALGGRRGRGRMYIPGCLETSVGSDGAILEPDLANIQDQVTAFGAALVLAGLPMVVLHSDATTPTPVTTLVVQAVIATQRRRLRR